MSRAVWQFSLLPKLEGFLRTSPTVGGSRKMVNRVVGNVPALLGEYHQARFHPFWLTQSSASPTLMIRKDAERGSITGQRHTAG